MVEATHSDVSAIFDDQEVMVIVRMLVLGVEEPYECDAETEVAGAYKTDSPGSVVKAGVIEDEMAVSHT